MEQDTSRRRDFEALKHFRVQERQRDHLFELLDVRAQASDRVERDVGRNAQRIGIRESCEQYSLLMSATTPLAVVSERLENAPAALLTFPRFEGAPLPKSRPPPASMPPPARAAPGPENSAALRGLVMLAASSSDWWRRARGKSVPARD